MIKKREVKKGFKELSKCVHIGASLDEFLEREGLLEYIEDKIKEDIKSSE